MTDIGNLIHDRRTELNLTLKEVGDYVGVSSVTVQKWEKGDIKKMRQDRIMGLAEILQISPLLLIDGADPEGEPAQPAPQPYGVTADIMRKISTMSTEELLELRGFIAGRFGK